MVMAMKRIVINTAVITANESDRIGCAGSVFSVFPRNAITVICIEIHKIVRVACARRELFLFRSHRPDKYKHAKLCFRNTSRHFSRTTFEKIISIFDR